MDAQTRLGPQVPRDDRPQTRIPPRRLAALCAGLLLIEDARIYGLIDFYPVVDRTRCRRVLSNMRQEGIVPTAEEAERAALDLMAALGMVRG